MKHSQGHSAQQGIDAAQLWLVIMVILAIMASIIMLISGSATALRLALLSALWAAVLGFLLVNRYKKTADTTRLQLVEQHKRALSDARRREAEFEAERLRIEGEVRSSLEMEYQKRHVDDVAALRAIRREVSRLRATLESMGAGDLGVADALHEVESKEVLEIESRYSATRQSQTPRESASAEAAAAQDPSASAGTPSPSESPQNPRPAASAPEPDNTAAAQNPTPAQPSPKRSSAFREPRSTVTSESPSLNTTPLSDAVFTRWTPSSSASRPRRDTSSSVSDVAAPSTSFTSRMGSYSSPFSDSTTRTSSTNDVPSSVSDVPSSATTPNSTSTPRTLSSNTLQENTLQESSEFTKMWEDAAKTPTRPDVQVEQLPTESVSKHRRPEANQLRRLDSARNQGGRRRKGDKASGVSVEELMQRRKKL